MIKKFCSENYNYIFNIKNGYFARWGKTFDDDPQYSIFGPEILDCEVSTICSNNCKWCYKSNTKLGRNMSLETFKTILDKFPKTLTQVALGIGDIDANSDLWNIMEYCRSKDIVPNITINGKRMTPRYYDLLSNLCGAVAVSLYNFNDCYNTVNELTSRRMDQINIHCLLSEETNLSCYKVLFDKICKSDPRINELNAIVYLRLKNKGRGSEMHQIKDECFNSLIELALKHNIKIGFDSCSAPYFLEAIKDNENYEHLKIMIEPCESSLFSWYINVDGIGFPCSFVEGVNGYKGVDVLNSDDFIGKIWNHEETLRFRDLLLSNHRNCPVYNLGGTQSC